MTKIKVIGGGKPRNCEKRFVVEGDVELIYQEDESDEANYDLILLAKETDAATVRAAMINPELLGTWEFPHLTFSHDEKGQVIVMGKPAVGTGLQILNVDVDKVVGKNSA